MPLKIPVEGGFRGMLKDLIGINYSAILNLNLIS
jgi:hypothetical protein